AAARAAGGLIVLDGVPDSGTDELLAAADVIRADHREAALLTGREITAVDDAVEAGRTLLTRGPSTAALEVPGEANVLVWQDGHAAIPLTAEH
ncbi:ribokinase, partial [Saccharothrix sp. MB29]|nr:ribokinase [Saccharothrix sp. MB29]